MNATLPARLLIVDDNRAQVDALSHALQMEGFATTGVGSSTEALDLLRTSAADPGNSFDVLITDFQMPGMNGIALLRAAHSIDEHLVSIVMTGHATIDTAVDAMRSGALDYIVKPINLRVTVPAVRRAIAVRRLRVENAALLQRLAERTAELEAANHELLRANRELDAFSCSVSHDMRQPLNAMIGFCDLLLSETDGELNPTQKHYAAEATRGGRRLMQLTDDLLRLSRLGQQPLDKKHAHIGAMVIEICNELRAQERPHGLDVRVGTLPDVSCDAGLMRQVFANLLSNAFKFTRNTPSARIDVDGWVQDEKCVYRVCDNGAGFDMKKADEMFTMFRRLHDGRDFEGTGVGLSIVRRILERHGGSITAEGAPGQGARFTLTLPAT
jgi:signal transduction histidine kinase